LRSAELVTRPNAAPRSAASGTFVYVPPVAWAMQVSWFFALPSTW
jgi:hypothetical protein